MSDQLPRRTRRLAKPKPADTASAAPAGEGPKLADRLRNTKSLQEILTCLGVGTWDYVLIGDGSATTWEQSCGWACLVVENQTEERWVTHGSLSHGTNVVGEFMAYAGPLLMLSQKNPRRKQSRGETLVHVITDSEYLVKVSRGQGSRDKYRPLWHWLDAFRRVGLFIKFHWVPRDVLEANRFCHNLANQARKGGAELQSAAWELIQKLPGQEQGRPRPKSKHTQNQRTAPSAGSEG